MCYQTTFRPMCNTFLSEEETAKYNKSATFREREKLIFVVKSNLHQEKKIEARPHQELVRTSE
jgi:hypothetical protein